MELVLDNRLIKFNLFYHFSFLSKLNVVNWKKYSLGNKHMNNKIDNIHESSRYLYDVLFICLFLF